MSKIETRGIAGFVGYQVTSEGHVLSSWRRGGREPNNPWRRLSPVTDAKGYLGLTICAPGVRRSCRVHRIVAEAFLPNPDGLPCVRHLDGNSKNNCVENLAWGSYADNENDKRAHGTWDDRYGGKLSKDDRETIRRLAWQGVSQKKIAVEMGVSRPSITRLLNGTTWRIDP